MWKTNWLVCLKSDTKRDDYQETYRGFAINFIAPNDGIVGVSVVDSTGCWQRASNDKFYDREFHLKEARAFIDSIA